MAEPGNFKFRERWQKQVRKDPQVIKDLLAIALLISTEARGDGTRALMSQQQLAEDLGVSESTAKRRIKKLQELGYLEVVERGGRRGDGTTTANVYELFLPMTQMMDSDQSQQVTQMTSRNESQQVTQMTYREPPHTQISTGQTDASTGQNGVSTGHSGDPPPIFPSFNPNELNCLTADAARANGNTKEPFTDWRAEDEEIFRKVMFIDHVTYEGHQYTTDQVYKGLRDGFNIRWPGRYLQEIEAHSEAAIDEYLDAKYPGMNRWDDYNP
jgi:biotin operon repressor